MEASQPSLENLEEKYRPYAEKEYILKEFNYYKKIIEEKLGIKLSNLEAVGLRKITEACLQQMVEECIKRTNGYTVFAQFEEIPVRFMQMYFDVEPGALRRWPTDEKNVEALREYFGRQQDKLHFF